MLHKKTTLRCKPQYLIVNPLIAILKTTEQAMPDTNTFIADIRDLIANDDFKTAIQQLSALLKNSPRLDEAVQQSARYNNVMRQIRLGLVDVEAANIAQNQTRQGLIDLLREIEEQGLNVPPINKEVAKFANGKTIIQNADKIYNINHIDNANFS